VIENYEIDQFGVIHQIEYEPITYDNQRLGWILGLLDRIPDSVLEIGYGTGTFIEAAKITGVPKCVGCDVTDFPLPDGVQFMGWQATKTSPSALEPDWDVVGMFDVLEHIPDLSFLEKLKTNYVAIAVPYCRWKELGDDWFRDWRMLLPNEHLHHFDKESLVAFMEHHDFKCLTLNTFEDGIRLREGESGPNILSGFFEKKS